MNTHRRVPTTLPDAIPDPLGPIDCTDLLEAVQESCCRYDGAHGYPVDRCLDCPDPAEATITLTATQLTDLAELLGEIDEFLRMGRGSIDALTDFYATHHDRHHPKFDALCLVDSISFTALGLRRQAQAAAPAHDNHRPDHGNNRGVPR
jgi:hypothetical protein